MYLHTQRNGNNDMLFLHDCCISRKKKYLKSKIQPFVFVRAAHVLLCSKPSIANRDVMWDKLRICKCRDKCQSNESRAHKGHSHSGYRDYRFFFHSVARKYKVSYPIICHSLHYYLRIKLNMRAVRLSVRIRRSKRGEQKRSLSNPSGIKIFVIIENTARDGQFKCNC